MRGFFGVHAHGSSDKRRPSAKWLHFSVLVAVTLLASLFPIRPALADDVTLTVNTWQPNYENGKVTYNVTISGLCAASSCTWKLESLYKVGGVEQTWYTISSGTVYGSPSNPAPFTKVRSATDSGEPETTHLKATVSSSAGASTDLKSVSGPYPDGGISFAVRTWTRDTDSGSITYDFDVKFVGAAQVGGPCNGSCYLQVDGVRLDGTTETVIHPFGTVTRSNYWTSTKTYTGTASGEITHLKARLYPSPDTRETYTALNKVSEPYLDGGISISVKNWTRVGSAVTHDLTAKFYGARQTNGPCDGTCTFYVEAIRREGSTDTIVHPFQSGTYKTNYWTYSQTFAGSTNMGDVTHLRARLIPSVGTRDSFVTTIRIPDGTQAPGVHLSVTNWTRDVDSGEVSYDVELGINDSITDPACATSCSWTVEAYYADGTIEQQQFNLGGSSLQGPLAFYGTRLTGSNLYPGEITELRASVTPTGTTVPQYTDVVHVSDPYPDGSVEIGWTQTSLDEVSNNLDYEMSLDIKRAAQVNGPCEDTCLWKVLSVDDAGVETVIHSGTLVEGTSSFSTTLTGSLDISTVGAVRARVERASGVGEAFADDLGVTGHVVDGTDLEPSAALLAAAVVAQGDAFCDVLLISGGPHVTGPSTPDSYDYCIATVQMVINGTVGIYTFLEGIRNTAGGPEAIVDLEKEHSDIDDPQPDVESDPSPPVPWLPDNDWDDNGCNWEDIVYTQESENHLITHHHIYEFRAPGKSYFNPGVNHQSLAESVFSYSEMPQPDPSNVRNCRRVVTIYPRNLGWSRQIRDYTHVYTLVTRKDSGEVVTMFPGLP